MTHEDVLTMFYRDAARERDRLFTRRDGRLEHLRTLELLERHLPSTPARVLDVGGGPGTYAAWLAERGYATHLIEPAPVLLEAAAAYSATLPIPFTTALGDARQLDEPDASCDAVLLLGPLYHLLDQADRAQVLDEAFRVLRPGGVVIAAALSRCCFATYDAAVARDLSSAIDERRTALETGVHRPPLSFTETYTHRASELADELDRAGITDASIFGIEGPLWPTFSTDERGPVDDEDPALQAALLVARLVESERDVIGASGHLLAVGRRPESLR